MSSRINTSQPQGKDLDDIIKEWWKILDASVGPKGDGQSPVEGKPSTTNPNYVFVYGHYEGTGPAAATHYGTLKEEHLNRTIVAPLVNGRYGIGESYTGQQISELSRSFGEAQIGVLQSRYTDSLYANVNRGGELIDIPQYDWVSHELPRSHDFEKSSNSDGYYFGMWIFIEPGQLVKGDVLSFGGKGGPSLSSPKLKDQSIKAADFVSHSNEALERFSTKAVWKIGETEK